MIVSISERKVHAAYSDLKKTANVDGSIGIYPGIEAVFDAFGIVVDCIDRFQTALRPTMHIACLRVFRYYKISMV